MDNCPFDPRTVGDQLRDKGGKFLTQGQRGCVLQMGAPDFDDSAPRFALFGQRIGQALQCGEQIAPHRDGHRDMHGGGKAVVR